MESPGEYKNLKERQNNKIKREKGPEMTSKIEEPGWNGFTNFNGEIF